MPRTAQGRAGLVDCLHRQLGESSGVIVLSSPNIYGDSSSVDLWQEATVPYNLRFQRQLDPLALIYPHNANDISAAVTCAARAGVPVAARSGGHSYGAYSLGGSIRADDGAVPGEPSLIIDMRPLREIHYDSYSQTVTVGSGALLGEMNELLERHGRTVPSGACPTVGVGGQALAGGFGLMSRSLGLLLDNLLEIRLVLANGTDVTSSDGDLFWAMRGAGPSFGIAYSFTFRTHPIPAAVQYYELTLLPRALPFTQENVARAARLYEVFEDFGEQAPPEWGMSWHVTPELSGGVWGTKVELLGQYHGVEGFDDAKGRLLEMLEEKGETDYHFGSRSLSFLESMHNVGGNWTRLKDRPILNTHEHVHFYAKSVLTKKRVPAETIHQQLQHVLALSETVNPSTHTDWFILSPFLGGQSAVVKGGGAFAHRDLRVVWELYAKALGTEGDLKPDEAVMPDTSDLQEVVNGMSAALPLEAVYPAYIDPSLSALQYPSLVWGSAYPRLEALKAVYDPTNVFRYPQSVRLPPASASYSFNFIGVSLLLVVLLVVYSIARRRSRPKRRVD